MRGHKAGVVAGMRYERDVAPAKKTPAQLVEMQREKYAEESASKTQSSEFAEVTFEDVAGPDYIFGAVVDSEVYKQILIKELLEQGITEIRGKPLEDAIHVSTTLTPEMMNRSN
jgi:hypothetical protein